MPLGYPKLFPREPAEKVIREAVLGHQLLKPHEHIVLDSPIVQRLRYIHQTGLAYLVYPTASHTRFDHSLGMAKIAERMGQSLGLTTKTIDTLRMASILHDVGHSIFSHISEALIKERFAEEYDQLKHTAKFSDCSFHEILSYFIVTSPRFREFFGRVCDRCTLDLDIDAIALLIIGRPRDPKRNAYLGDIIHGPFDADKLDYLVRDCYFTGIRADVDVDRVVLACCKLMPERFQEQHYANLIIRKAGVSNLEQIVLHKMLLFSAIYHHQKVRTLECMVRGIFETIWADPSQIANKVLRFQNASDFLRISEFEFFAMGALEPQISEQINRILKRDLLKRCLVISPNLLWKSPNLEDSDLYTIGDEFPQKIRQLREFIWAEIPTGYRTSFNDLCIDLPEPPNINNDADRC